MNTEPGLLFASTNGSALARKSGRGLKRTEDILVALCALALIWPILFFIAVFIKLDSKGPVIYKQKREGLHGKVFWIYKFRSMEVAPEPEGMVVQAAKDDSRVTRVGRFIRRVITPKFSPAQK